MAADLRRPDLEDPFANCSALSLLPRTLGAHVRAAPSLLEAQEEDAIRNLFKSMALKGSKEFLEQAQRIKKSCSNFLSPHPEDGDKTFTANGKDRPQGRRPALGRKRAQFSLKPNSSHSVPTVDFDSGIDHIEDPEEYFLAFELFENADKELKKLRGEVSTDLLQNQQSPTARKRRPGILRKTASYKHHFPAKVDIAEIFKGSQEEISDKRTFSPSNTSTIAESSNILHPRTVDEPDIPQFRKTNSEYLDATERQGSVTDKEKKVNDILDKLLTSFEDLDEDEGATLLRESLHIKSIDVGKVCLPEFHNVQKNHIGTLEGRMMRKELEGCQLSQNSSSLVRSRLAAFSTLQRRISLVDPYSVPPIDDAPISGVSSRSKGEHENSLSPPANIGHHERNGSVADDASSPVMVNDKRLSLVDQLDTPVSGADRTMDSKITTEEELTEYSPCLLENAMEQSHNKVDNGKDASAGLDGHVEEECHDMQLDALISDQPDAGAEGPTTGCKVPTEREALPSPHHSSMPQNHSRSGIDVDANLHGPDDILQDEATIPAQEVVVGVGAFKDNSDLVTTVLPMDVQSENEHVIPEENNERQGLQEGSGEPQKKDGRQKAPRHEHNRKKITSRRQSLADAGMMWKSGVRRSTRIRSRPLQYWRGERFLYGRIHDSLATVIGVKRASPGNSALKVKSFVSEEYADLVAQAGLH